MTDVLDQIVALIDAAVPAEAPEIPRAEDRSTKRQARRQPRTDRPSSSAPGTAAALPGAAGPRAAAPVDSSPPYASHASAAPVAAAPSATATVISFRPSSQSGGSSEKRSAIGNEGGGARPPVPPTGARTDDDGEGLNLRLAKFPHTDLGNTERFRERNSGKFLWCPALGWLWWDGRRWCRDGADERVKAAEHDTVRAIQDEAVAVRGATRSEIERNPDARGPHDMLLGVKKIMGAEQDWYLSDALAAWGRTSEQANRLAPIAKGAAPYLYVATEQLDADPFKMNVANGTLIFRKVKDADYITFRPHDPADLMTKCSPVHYDPLATCPHLERFMIDVQPAEPDRRFLLQWQGLNLTGDVTDQGLALFWGKGRNGKSTWVDLMAYIGGDYSETVPIETFLNQGRTRGAGQATPDLAMLPGVRHLRTSEPNKGAKLDEALIKLATGGERILARHLNRDFFGFYPQFKLTISGNYRPHIVGADEGIWRRTMLVPWSVTIPKEKIDRDLGTKLRGEASGVLNRLLDGLRDWFDNGLIRSENVLKATASYRSDSDPLGRFLEACVRAEIGSKVQSSVMHEVFCAWAKVNGATEWTNKGMTAALEERGYQKKHSGPMWWLDVKLIHAAGDFIDKDGKPIVDSRGSQEGGGDDEVVF
jgi:putative DNA primase/helicase